MSVIKDLYNSLKGQSRSINGELTIKGFTDQDYQELYESMLDILSFYIGDNYEYWFTKWARSLHRKKSRSRHTFDFYDPQYEKHVYDQTVREQLVVIKHFLERRTYSRYNREEN